MPSFEHYLLPCHGPTSRRIGVIGVDLRVDVRGSASTVSWPDAATRHIFSTLFSRSGTNVVRGRMRVHRFGG
jgi:hypothetical protein